MIYLWDDWYNTGIYAYNTYICIIRFVLCGGSFLLTINTNEMKKKVIMHLCTLKKIKTN